MAFGTVPIVTPAVAIKDYSDPPIENVHYLFVNNPSELEDKVSKIDKRTWKNMSQNCMDWYKRNVHSANCWNTTLQHIFYSN